MKYFLISIALFMVFTAYLQAFNTKGLVLYLKLDEGNGATAKDTSGEKNHGEIMGDAEWVDGELDKAIRLSDSAAGNMIVVKDNATLDITDQITIGMWANIETVPDGSCSLITKADTYMIHTSNWSGKGIEQELLLWPFDTWQSPISTPIPFGEWHHVVGTFGGNKLRTYVDGVFIAERNFASDIAVTESDLVVGRDNRSCCNTRSQLISVDEVFAFNREISENDINDLMAGNVTAVSPTGRLSTLWGEIKAEK